jgi:SAM-dependent methyltransferase
VKKDFELIYHKVEKNHFWFKSRRNYILDVLKNHSRDSSILDIGSSSGILLLELMEAGFKRENLYGIDISETAIENCRKNGIENAFVMDAQKITLPRKFDVIIASDCLEHLQDDSAAIANWTQLLNENGCLLVFVPAFMSLWSSHDEANMHYRRYTLPQLKKMFTPHRVSIQQAGYWNFSLFTPVFLWRKISSIRRMKNDNHENASDLDKLSVFNPLLLFILNLENRILKYIRFPFGISAFCVVKYSTSKKQNP